MNVEIPPWIVLLFAALGVIYAGQLLVRFFRALDEPRGPRPQPPRRAGGTFSHLEAALAERSRPQPVGGMNVSHPSRPAGAKPRN